MSNKRTFLFMSDRHDVDTLFAVVTCEGGPGDAVDFLSRNDDRWTIYDLHGADIVERESFTYYEEGTESDSRTPVMDHWCTCPLPKHRESMHGTSPEWDDKHYWILPKK